MYVRVHLRVDEDHHILTISHACERLESDEVKEGHNRYLEGHTE